MHHQNSRAGHVGEGGWHLGIGPFRDARFGKV